MHEDEDGIIMMEHGIGIPKSECDLWIEEEKTKILQTFTTTECEWIFKHSYKNKFKKEFIPSSFKNKKTHEYLELKFLFKQFGMDEKDLDWAIGRHNKWC